MAETDKNLNGIVCINKAAGITSFGVCKKIRQLTGTRKVGHMGTLDPMATGVLPIMVGRATRFLDYVPNSDKGYRASFRLGEKTDTLDSTGTVTEKRQVNVTEAQVEEVFNSFFGEIEQIPPMYSAVQVDGKRLYEYARHGEKIDRKPRKVEIKYISVVEYDNETHEGMVDVLCSKGTYIRSLIDDAGEKLGCGAVMTALQRIYAMGFSIDDAIEIEKLQYAADVGADFSDYFTPVDIVLKQYVAIYLNEKQSNTFRNGGSLVAANIDTEYEIEHNKYYRVYDHKKRFMGLGRGVVYEGERAKRNGPMLVVEKMYITG